MRPLSIVLASLAGFVTSPCSVAAATTPQDDLVARLERLTATLEEQRNALHIPGMALAIVKDGEIIFERGFGLADIESGRAVDGETLFAIGSSSKAFTAAVIATLIDEGTMGWDEPATTYLPWFQLPIQSDDANAMVTIRDLLSHRTGFTRMDGLWAAGAVPREEILRTALQAEPYAPYHTSFLYNNIMFLAAGECAAAAAGQPYETLLVERLLEPLNMNDSNISYAEAQADARLSSGYIWEEEKQDYKKLPMRNIDIVVAAGGINSNVRDMSNWLRLLLGRGEFDGTRIFSEECARELWTPATEIGPGESYGLGWFLHDWNGQPYYEHGGNIDGFAASVGLLPESNIGFVLLSNVSASPLQASVGPTIFKALLLEPEVATALGATENFDEFLGTYHADFGGLQDVDLTVLIQNERLAVDVPGQMVYELNPPNVEGKRYFAITHQIAVSFVRDEADRVVSLKLFQAGLEFEAPRAGVEIAPEIPLEELAPYLGEYRSQDGVSTVTVLIHNNRLAVDVPEQMIYELHPPDAEGRWNLRIGGEKSARFDKTPEGAIASLTLIDKGEIVDTFERDLSVPVAENEPLPTMEEINALTRKVAQREAMLAWGQYRMRGTVRVVHSGMNGSFTASVAGDRRYRMDVSLGKFGESSTIWNDDKGWEISSYTLGGSQELTGEQLLQIQTGHPGFDLESIYARATMVRRDEVKGRPVYVVRYDEGELPPVHNYIDVETGDILRTDSSVVIPGIGPFPIETMLDDYRDVAGARIPFRTAIENPAVGKTVFEIMSIERNVVIDENLFAPPAIDASGDE